MAAGEGGLQKIDVTTAAAEGELYLHGAHVTHWQPHGHDPVIFMSEEAVFANDKAIRGGVPICFPWFGPHPTDTAVPIHGYARLRDWQLTSFRKVGDGAEVVLSLDVAPFKLTYTVTFDSMLTLSLRVLNTDSKPREFEAALHTYFEVADVRNVTITGLKGREYLDKTRKAERFRQDDEPIKITEETDRVYLATRDTVVIHDPGLDRTIEVQKSGSEATIIWNPWVEKAKALKDFGDDEWPLMLCVESGCVGPHSITLPPSESHVLTQVVRVS